MSLTQEYQLVPHPLYKFMQISPTPTQAEITKYYEEEFYSTEYKRFNDSSMEVQIEDKEYFEATWSDVVASIKEILGKRPSDLTVLDVGCGWAQALMYFSGLGMDCYGFDPATEAVDYALKKGLNVRKAGMERMDVFDGMKFDVVMLNNVLEHLADPVKVMTDLHEKVVKERGLLIVDVPNEFNDFQLAGRDVHGLNDWWIAPPGHLNYFSRQTLCNLLQGCGFEVVLTESSFPLELFLLFGECYVGDNMIGKACHGKRVNFELNMRKYGHGNKLRKLYQALSQLDLGRQIRVYATPV